MNLRARSDVVGALGHPIWKWRERLTQKDLPWKKEWLEEESELFFSGGKDYWRRFWETTLAIDQKE